jgi:hypothetical protein
VLKRDLGKFKRQRIVPAKTDPWRGSETTAAERIAEVLRLTAERDARLERDRQLRLVASVPDPPVDKAG